MTDKLGATARAATIFGDPVERNGVTVISVAKTMEEVRALCADILPGASIKKHLLWRYSIVWEKIRIE